MSQLLSAILLTAGILALASGLLVLVSPKSVKRLNLPLGDHLTTLYSPIRTERFYYRYHRITGPLTALGGGLLCLTGWLIYSVGVGAEDWDLFLRAMGISFLIFGPGIIILGLVVFIRPSAIRPVEILANKPVNRENISNQLIRFRLGVVSLTLKYPRTFGVVFAILGALLLIIVLRLD